MKKKILKQYFSLSHNIKLYIPSTLKGHQKTDTGNYVKETLTLFSSKFGGATAHKAKGAWLSNTYGLITENITIVESYATAEQVDHFLEDVITFALKIKKELQQESVALEYDHELHLI